MTAGDVAEVARVAPDTQVIAVHMEAINHCGVRRQELERHLQSAGLQRPVMLPQDGEALAFEGLLLERA
jgi:hypothetical protein